MSAFANKKFVAAVAVVAAAALALSGCASKGDSYAKGDGTLKFGGVLPLTGALSFLSPPEIAGVELAIQDINAAGGVLGKDVTWTLEDSSDGDHPEIAPASATKVLGEGVDVVIGAAASGVTRLIIDQITKAKTVQISMSNTAPDLSTWADGGYYFRTAPSDLLQGAIVGNTVVQDGNQNVAIIYQQTSYGEGLDAKAKSTIEAAGATVVANLPFPEAETNFDTIVDQVVAAGADSVLVISYDEIKKIVPALQKKKFDGSKIYLVDGNLANFSDQAWAGYIEGAKGTLPGGKLNEAFKTRAAELYKTNHGAELTEFAYLGESYDAVVLAALAAEAAGNDSGEAISKNLQAVSTGGDKFDVASGDSVEVLKAAFAAAKDGKDIDFDGFSGPIDFDDNGDPTGASIGVYQYGKDGTSTLLNVVAGNSVN
ncbi:ABC transporter substrate-binding protein [Rhodoluna sp.]|uniref:ABC transporter substrate-binding protein n=1 Tax=Rhodoluna sp. TaxID=1969481 RepID=UPI0025E303AE|nr:ABC transporter substrate-binding protein [Rhodoluna sp.]